MWNSGTKGEHDAGEVDSQNPIPLVEIEVGDGSRRDQNAGVRVRDIERPKFVHEVVDGRGDRIGIGDVGRSGCGAPTDPSYVIDERSKLAGVETDRRDIGSFARSSQRGLASDTALRASDKHDMTGKSGGRQVSHDPRSFRLRDGSEPGSSLRKVTGHRTAWLSALTRRDPGHLPASRVTQVLEFDLSRR